MKNRGLRQRRPKRGVLRCFHEHRSFHPHIEVLEDRRLLTATPLELARAPSSVVFDANAAVDPSVAFVAHGSEVGVSLLADGVLFGFGDTGSPPPSAAELLMTWTGGNGAASIIGLAPVPSRQPYDHGPNVPSTELGLFERVRYEEVYAGIDLEFYGRGRDIEFDWIVEPGIDPAQIMMVYAGMDSLALDAGGNLLFDAGNERLVQHAPFVYQVVDGRRREVASSYRLDGSSVGFAVGPYDASLPLVIDPVVNYSTYLGGSRNESASGIAVDTDGNTYVIGTTRSTNFADLDGPDINVPSAFVARYAANGELAYATTIGPLPRFDSQVYAESTGRQMAMGPDNVPVVVYSELVTQTIPLQSGGYAALPAPDKLRLAALDEQGEPLIDVILPWLPEEGEPDIYVNVDLAVDETGTAYVIYGAVGTDGSIVPYLTAVSPAGDFLYTEKLFALPTAITVDDQANIYLAFTTSEPELPVSEGAFQSSKANLDPDDVDDFTDVYVAMYEGNIAFGPFYATYLGGTDNDVVFDLAVKPDQPGRVYVVGSTFSQDFPVADPFQSRPVDGPTTDGRQNAFVALFDFNATGAAQLPAATYLGGRGGDVATGVALDAAGQVYVVGETNSNRFPIVAPLIEDWTSGGVVSLAVPVSAHDHFVTKLDAEISYSSFSTYYGGSGHDYGALVAVGSDGAIHVAGTSAGRFLGPDGPVEGGDFPRLNAAQEVFAGGDFGFGVLETDAVVYSIAQRGVIGGRGSRLREGQPFSGIVADLANLPVNADPAAYAVTVNWGDGTTSPGTLARQNPGGLELQVVGAHQYASTGAYPVVARIESLAAASAPIANINLSHSILSQTGPVVAVDPANPRRLFAAMSTEPDAETDSPGLLVATSNDGGLTWSPRRLATILVDGLPAAAGNPDAQFDDLGNLFLTYQGADGNNVVVAWSTDGGRTFEEANVIELTAPGSTAGNPAVGSPKLAMSLENHEVWVAFEDLQNDRIVAAGANVSGPGEVGAFALVSVNGSAGGEEADIAVGPNGDVMVVWQFAQGGAVQILSSVDLDGLGANGFALPTQVHASGTSGEFEIAAQMEHVGLGASLAWDTSGGPHHGRLYVAYVDMAEDPQEPGGEEELTLFVRYTENLGVDWSAPQRVSLDASFVSMFLPSVAVDLTTGDLAVGWYGTSGPTALAHYYVATSADGVNFSDAQQVSLEPSDANNGELSSYARERGYGEAPGMAFLGGRLYPVWSDNTALAGESTTSPEFEAAMAIVGVLHVNAARVAIRPVPIVAVRDELFDGTVATFTHPDVARTAGDFAVEILWGDGEQSTGAVTQPGGPGTPFVVRGEHLYTEPGAYPLGVEVTDLRSGLLGTPVSNITAQQGSQAEATIAIDPSNPDRVFAAGVDASRRGTFYRGIPVSFSTDGGVTWTSRWIADNTDGLPAACCDPWAVFDQFGNLFLTYVTSSQPEREVVVLLSTDGGQTFTLLHMFSVGGVDQPSVAVGPGPNPGQGSVWLTWQQGQGIWAARATVNGLGSVGAFSEALVAPTTGGEDVANFGTIAVGPDGQVLLSYVRNPLGAANEIVVQLDADGLGPSGFGAPIVVGSTNVPTGTRVPAQDTDRGIENRAMLAWDRSDGPHRGRVYLVYTDAAALLSTDTNIFLRYSDNAGVDWSDPIQVNDDGTTLSQFLPTLAVDQSSGNLAVGWHTGFADNIKTHFVVRMSDDGGASFREMYFVSPGESDSTDPTIDDAGKRFSYGDYTGISFVNGVIQPIWADNSAELDGIPDPRQFDLANARIAVAQVSRPALVLTGTNVEGVQGAELDVELARFPDPDASLPEEYHGTIDWGDGSEPSEATIARLPDGTFTVSGTHDYERFGTFTVTVSVVGYRTRGEVTLAATIENAPLLLAATSDLRVVRQKPFSEPVGTLTDDNPHSTAGDFDVTIGWGDGSFTVGTLELDEDQPGHVFQIRGMHKYLSETAFPITISVREKESGQVLIENGQIVSGDPSLEVDDYFLDIDALAGINTGGLVLVTFTRSEDDEDVPLDTGLGAYLATINWGDGTVETNVIPFVTDEDVTVTGQHTYAAAGDYFPSITLRDDSGGVFHASLVARVSADATGRVRAVGSGLVYNPLSEHYVAEVTVTNSGNEPIRGPMYVVFDQLPDGVTIENIEELTGEEDPVVQISFVSLAPGASLDPIEIEFNNPGGVPITYRARVFSPLESSVLPRSSLSFEPNVGQVEPGVAFVSRGANYAVFLTDEAAAIRVQGSTQSAAAQMRWRGGNESPTLVGIERQVATSNYFTGADPKSWLTGVANYGRVRYQDVYAGIDLEYYGRDGQLEFDWIVDPGASPGDIVMEFAGAEHVAIDRQGNLRLTIGDGQFVQKAPLAYQVVSGRQQVVESRYVIHADGSVGFQLGAYDPQLQLVIDPVLVFSTFYGGNWTIGTAVAVDEEGNSYVTGSALLPAFPTSVGAFQQHSLDQSHILDPVGTTITPEDAFVVKFNPQGVPIFSTYLSGKVADAGVDIVVDAAGQVYVLGITYSSDFPTRAAFQPQISNPAPPGFLQGQHDIFITKLSADGSQMIYSSFLGGELNDYAGGLTVDATGAAYIVGSTFSRSMFPIVNAVQPQYISAPIGSVQTTEAFVVKVSPSGSSIEFSTYLGHQGWDFLESVVLDNAGNIVVVGYTDSQDLPTRNALQSTFAYDDAAYQQGLAVYDILLARLSADGSMLDVLTYLGGLRNDQAHDVTLDRDGNIVIVGRTNSLEFPLRTNPLPPSEAVGGFIITLSGALSEILDFTILGGNGDDVLTNVATDDAGNILVFGRTTSDDLPVVAPLQGPQEHEFGTETDGILGSYNPATGTFNYLTYLGGSKTDFAFFGLIGTGGNQRVRPGAMAADRQGNVVVTGTTFSQDFPLYNSVENPTSLNGAYRMLLTRIAAEPPAGFNRLELTYSTLAAVEGTSLDGIVASFFAVGQEQAGGFTATIDWGDGTVTPGVVVASSIVGVLGRRHFDVLGAHVYEDLGNYDVLVTVRNAVGETALPAGTSATSENEPRDHVRYRVSIDTSSLAGQNGYLSVQFNSGASEIGGDTSLLLSQFVIAGGSLSATVSHDGGATGSFDGAATLSPTALLNRVTQALVFGNLIEFDLLVEGGDISHPLLGLFGKAIAFQLLAADGVTPLLTTDPSGAVATIRVEPDGSTRSDARLAGPTARQSAATALPYNLARIVNAPVVAELRSIAVQEGAEFSGTVVTFTNANPFEHAQPHQATIDWGDGTSSPGTITLVDGEFNVIGTHTYARAGSYVLKAVITEPDGASAAVEFGGGGNHIEAPRRAIVGATLTSATSYTFGDFNGDGHIDIATGNVLQAPGLSHFSFGASDLEFLPSTTVAMPNRFGTATAGDVNGDGIDDLINAGPLSTAGTEVLSVVLGSRTGPPMALATTTPLPAGVSSIVTGDFNGDGRLDVAIGSSSGWLTVSVFLGVGDGTFAPRQDYTADIGNKRLVVADVNGDGFEDLVVANSSSSNVRVFLGTGSGLLAALAPFSAGGTINGLAIADVNGDAYPDILAASGDVAVMTGNGDGTFTVTRRSVGLSAGYIAAGDFNGDGRGDIAVADGVQTAFSMLVGQTDGTFAFTQSATTGAVRGLWAMDLDHDGRLDVITGDTANNLAVRIFPGRGDGTVEAETTLVVGVTMFDAKGADLNGDGFTDLITPGPSGVLVSLGRGDGTFEIAPTISAGQQARQLRIVDVDGDGRSDVVTVTAASGTASLRVLLRQADGSYQLANVISLPSTPQDLAVGDFNGDGRPDVVMTFISTNFNLPDYFGVLLNQPNGTFSALQSTPTLRTPSALLLQDLNADGRLDVAVRVTGSFDATFGGYANAGLQVFKGVGDGTFLAPVSAPGGYSSGQVLTIAAVDLNGDSVLDLVTVSEGNGNPPAQEGIHVHLGKPDGTYAPAQRYLTGLPRANWTVTAADFNRDGKPDVAVSRSVTGTNPDPVLVLFGNGDGTLAAPVSYDAGQHLGYVRAADVDGDGWIDLIAGSTTTMNEGTGVLLNRKDGTFAPVQFYFAGGSPWFFDVGDLNSDGRIDVAVANVDQGTITLLYGKDDGTLAGQLSNPAGGGMRYLEVVDANRDGILDVAYYGISLVGLMLGTGDGHFRPTARVTVPAPPNWTTAEPIDLTFGDTDGSGNDELIVGLNTVGSVLSYLVLPDGSLGPPRQVAGPARNSAHFAFGDFNGDGLLDFARLGNDSFNQIEFDVEVLLGQGNGSFIAHPQRTFVGRQGMDLVAADFNGDGRLDLAVASLGDDANNHAGGGIRVLFGDGTGGFAAPLILDAGIPYYALAADDMNGDGHQDLILHFAQTVQNQNQALAVMYNRGDATFSPALRFDVAPRVLDTTVTPTRISTADFTGDGYPDIIALATASDGTVRIVRNIGAPAGADVANAPIHVSANDLATTVGVLFAGAVASFTDDNPLSIAADFLATITWGDGHDSPATIHKLPDGRYEIRGSHVYAAAGTYATKVELTELLPFTRYAAAGSAAAADAAPDEADAGPDQNVSEGTPVILEGVFVNSIPSDAPTYLWQVTSTNGQVVADGHAAIFSFLPNDNGIYTATFTVTTAHGVVSDSATITVSNALPLAAIVGAGGTYGQSASFTLTGDDDSSVDLAAGFAFHIHWGDGTPDTTVTRSAGNASGVIVSHTFAAAGPFSVEVTSIDKDGGTSAVTSLGVTVSKAHLTVNAENKSKVYGDASPALSAGISGFVAGETLATSGVTGQAALALVGDGVHAGQYAITVGLGSLAAANYDFPADNFLSGTLNVTPAELTITAQDKSKLYGAALVALTAKYDGFVNGDTPASLTTPPTLSTTATASSHVGNYPITAGGAVDSDYTISYLPGIFAVTPAPLAIKAVDKSKLYGAAILALTAEYDGLVNGDTPASLTTPPTLSTTATAGSPVGSYPITASAAVDPDYTISYLPGTLTITPAPLTIKADDKTKAVGAPNPPLTFMPIGLVNGDTAASLATQPLLSTAATTSSPAGAYPITVGGAASPNYTINYVPGTLTITPVEGGVISGTVYLDVTGNGLSADDLPYGGVQVYLDSNNNGKFDLGEPSTTTLANGGYSFDGLGAGNYKVREVTPLGYIRTAPVLADSYSVSLASGQTVGGSNFANAALGDTSVVTDVVYVINGTTVVGDLNGRTSEGDTVQVSFRVVEGAAPRRFTLVSYVAPWKAFDPNTAAQQQVFQVDTGMFGPGTHTLDVRIPHSYYQIDFVVGAAIEPFGPANSNVFYSAQTRLIGYDNGGTKPVASGAASLSGFVYHDANNNGVFDANERPIPGASVTLSWKQGKKTYTQTVVTDTAGKYLFDNLSSGTYTIKETQPEGYTDGSDSQGTAGGSKSNDQFSNIKLSSGANGERYNFGERQTVAGPAASNQTGSASFWNGTSGQNLIKALNGSQNSKTLGNWLAANFGNLFGAAAGSSNNLANKANSQVASYFKSLYGSSSRREEAETLALALNVYVTTSGLAGNTAASYGLAVSENGLGAATVNAGSAGAAFGLDDDVLVTVSELLLRINARSRKGRLWDVDGNGSLSAAETILRSQAASLFRSINDTC